jgi:23S rRNA pseudouridine1911/1915/1917 synthase
MSATSYTVPVPEDKAGSRLDRLLAAALPELSRTRIKALIESGHVSLVAREPLNDANYRVKAGQSVVVEVPPVAPATPEPQAMDLVVVHEDDHLIVVDKPAGLVVHPAPGNPDRTLVNALLAHCGDSLSGIGGIGRPGIVHRLDKDTSGLMVAAKNDIAHRGLARQFAEHSLERAYFAVVWGRPQPRQGEITGNIGRNTTNRKKMAVVERGGKPALTRYTVIRPVGTLASLVECRLATGRTHQIRVHMATRGHPVIGDPLYGGGHARRLRGVPESASHAVKALNRQALHAYLIGFEHPITHEKLHFESSLSHFFNELMTNLEIV